MSLTPATAQNVETVDCMNNETLTGSYADVIVNGTSCTLDGATVKGSVLVDSGGTLTASGGAAVDGSVQVDSGGDIDLDDVTVLGDVTLKDSGDVNLGSAAAIGALKLDNSGAIFASGALGSIETKESAGISLNGAVVFPGGVSLELANGSLVICGSTIEGTVNVVSTIGNVLVQSSCGPSSLNSSVSVEKGSGNVRLLGATLAAGDLSVIEQNGNVKVNGTSLSDLKIEKISGTVTLREVVTDSDTTIADNGGNVKITQSTLGSDVEIKSNGAVIVTNNDFSLEDVLISNNSGPVKVKNNVDFSISIIENDNVVFNGNSFVDADISKNSGGVSIKRNIGEKLNCSDNTPPTNRLRQLHC